MQAHAAWSFSKTAIPFGLLCTQLLALSPLLQAIWLTYRLPEHVDQRYDIYQGVDAAPARILLPTKTSDFSVLATDAGSISDAGPDVAEQLPYCGGIQHGSLDYTPTNLPLWTLPTDESGLNGFMEALVRATLDTRTFCALTEAGLLAHG